MYSIQHLYKTVQMFRHIKYKMCLISLLKDSRKDINFGCMYDSVSIVTRLRKASSGLNACQGHIFFSSPRGPDRLWFPSTLVLSENVPGNFTPTIINTECEGKLSPPRSAKACTVWIYTSTYTYNFMTWGFLRHSNSFTSTDEHSDQTDK